MQLHFKLQAKGVQTLTRCFNLVQLFVQGRTLFLQLYVRTLRTPHLNLRPSLHFKWHKLEGGAIHQTAIHAKTRCHINVHHLYCPHGRNTTRNSNTQNAIQMPLFHNGVRMPILWDALSARVLSRKAHPRIRPNCGSHFPELSGSSQKNGCRPKSAPVSAVYLRIKPPRSSMASQKASAKRGSLAAIRALVAIQPEGVPVS